MFQINQAVKFHRCNSVKKKTVNATFSWNVETIATPGLIINFNKIYKKSSVAVGLLSWLLALQYTEKKKI